MIRILIRIFALAVTLLITLSAALQAESASTNSASLAFGDSRVAVEFLPGRYRLPKDTYLKWLRTAGSAVSEYFSRFPVSRLTVRVESTSGDEVGFSTADFGGRSAVIEIPIGRNISEKELLESWQATHEMVHLGFPLVDDDHKWVAEGMATYIEPIARMQVGDLTAEQVWGDMLDNMPRGQRTGVVGLKNATEIDDLYWGGAIFCLVADLEIRKKTGNRLGLQDALAGIANRGGNIRSDWEVPAALAKGDEAIGQNILIPLYNRFHNQRVDVDLPALWRTLGVKKVDGRVLFNEKAPLAPARRAINRQGKRPNLGR